MDHTRVSIGAGCYCCMWQHVGLMERLNWFYEALEHSGWTWFDREHNAFGPRDPS
jgi:hypothetical protein